MSYFVLFDQLEWQRPKVPMAEHRQSRLDRP